MLTIKSLLISVIVVKALCTRQNGKWMCWKWERCGSPVYLAYGKWMCGKWERRLIPVTWQDGRRMCGKWESFGSPMYLAGWEVDVWEVGEVWNP
jgi:hypothetical protein